MTDYFTADIVEPDAFATDIVDSDHFTVEILEVQEFSAELNEVGVFQTEIVAPQQVFEVHALERDHDHAPVSLTLAYNPSGQLQQVSSSKGTRSLAYVGQQLSTVTATDAQGALDHIKQLGYTGNQLTSATITN